MRKGTRKEMSTSGKRSRAHLAGFVAIAVAVSLTPAVAAKLVQTSDIANKAVTTAKINNKAVKPSKLAKLPKRRFVGAAKQPKFKTGGQGDCIWSPATAIIPTLGDVNFYKDLFGIVHMGGLAIAADGPGGDADCGNETEDFIAFQLPKSYRPAYSEIQGVSGGTMIIVGRKKLVSGPTTLPPGSVFASTGTVALDGITFRTTGGASATSTSSTSSAGASNAEARKALQKLLGL